MLRRPLLAVTVMLALLARAALADPDAGTCVPNHDRGMKVISLGSELMRLAMSKPLQSKEDLGAIRTMVEGMPRGLQALACDEPALSAKELADAKAFETRTSKWISDETKVLAAEQEARDEVIVPLCEATWMVQQMREAIAKERSNPGGVVDLKALHDWGANLQDAQAQIAALSPRYIAFRHHAFTDWQTEGACVAASKAPTDN